MSSSKASKHNSRYGLMAQALNRYHTRAPRYNLHPDDHYIIRFAYSSKRNGRKKMSSFTTTLLNISQSGLAFKVDSRLRPTLGETIMIEFTVPNAKQMACYARVTRIEEEPENFPLDYDSNDTNIIIGVRFFQLLDTQQNNISIGLKEKFKQLEQQERYSNKYQQLWLIQEWFKRYRTHIFLGSLNALVLLIIFLAVAK